MPELPEVETMVRQLRKQILAKTITAIDIRDTTIIDPKVRILLNRKIVGLSRRAKALIMELQGEKCAVVRLGMTGHFYYLSPHIKNEMAEKHMAVKFNFKDHSVLTFNDTRRFGSLRVLDKHQLQQQLGQFGPEPLGTGFTAAKFKELLSKKKNAVIKTVLMDQRCIAGIGNIYAQEALYLARINPWRKIGSLSEKEINNLYQKLRKTLRLAIQHSGTTILNYLHLDGSGKFQKFLTVYQQKKCPQKHLLKKIYLGSRGTFYCPKCQR